MDSDHALAALDPRRTEEALRLDTLSRCHRDVQRALEAVDLQVSQDLQIAQRLADPDGRIMRQALREPAARPARARETKPPAGAAPPPRRARAPPGRGG